SSISSESSPVSSPATNQSSPVSTPKRGPLGPVIVPPGGHNVPSTPPVVTIAPTKTVNGLWRSESRPVREVTSSSHLILYTQDKELRSRSNPSCSHALMLTAAELVTQEASSQVVKATAIICSPLRLPSDLYDRLS
ncbi:genetic suppressor element 1 isoform X1, partial [Tachysurus ichikawai]